jgi:hypothetical protein
MARLRFPEEVKIRSLSNQYKRHDVFRCYHDGHAAFDYRVSVYHVLREKRCYPQGCLGFVWKCMRFNKGLSCSRGFRHAGKKCFGCKHFVDEKVNFQPEVILPSNQFETFQGEIREFENWLQEVRGREINYTGTVFSIKPHLTMNPARDGRIFLHGFLIVLRDGFVNMVQVIDSCYLRVSSRLQEKYRFRPGDRLDFFARISEDRGRILLDRINRVEFEFQSEGPYWNESKARVALQAGSLLDGQREACIHCERGCLIDVEKGPGNETRIHRRLFCLEGFYGPWACGRPPGRKNEWDMYFDLYFNAMSRMPRN